jgi:pyrroline-5-carboxylate reductase
MEIAIIGVGVMGGALARQLALQGHNLFLVGRNIQDPAELAKEIGASCCTYREALAKAQVIFIAVKPKNILELAKMITPFLTQKHILISALAGISLATLQKHLPGAVAVRIMPNICLKTGTSVIGVVEPVAMDTKQRVQQVLYGVGDLFFLPESSMDSFTALSGSMPGFIFLILEALVEGGVSIGFPYNDAKNIVIKTIASSLALASEKESSLADLKLQVCSPSGTTIAGIMEMEDRGLRSALYHALEATKKRSEEISRSIGH